MAGKTQLIKLVKPDEAQGEVKQVYDEIIAIEGKKWLVPLWGFFAIVPKLLRLTWETLKALEIEDGHVPRRLMSSIAFIGAAEVGCKRCANYHEMTMIERMGVDPEYVAKLRDFENSDLPEKEKAAFRFAKKLAFGQPLEEEEFNDLRKHGYTDAQIVEMATIALFETSLARHAYVLAQYEDVLDWPAEYTPSEFYKKHIAS